jgi:hypothetical protein
MSWPVGLSEITQILPLIRPGLTQRWLDKPQHFIDF